ncbi:MAG TPA: TPM domain-containing protein [Nitrospira sp.]|nr:TPM domain-containing protein [Nitrospira sp.]
MAIGKQHVLTKQERARVEAVVQAAEQATKAEIVPVVVARSGLYRETQHRAGLILSLLVLTMLLTIETAWLPWGWHATNAVWLLTAITLGYGMGSWIGTWPAIVRLLTSRERMRQKVQLRAELAFSQHGIAHTREQTGLLLMISLLERQVYVLADHALAALVPSSQWQEVVAVIIERMKAGELVEGLCRGIETSGVILARACPSMNGDNPNELSNEVIQDP